MDIQRFTALVLDIGEKMLISGAEIYRIEDTMTRICRAYNAKHVDIFTITTFVILTVQMEDEPPCTQTRRISDYRADLDYLNNLNELSRTVCQTTPDLNTFENELKQIQQKPYSNFVKCCTNALIAISFSLFAGGTLADASISAFIGVMLMIVTIFMRNINVNQIFSVFCSAAFCGILAAVFITFGIGHSINNIIIGDIMILVPGLALTNSIRDMINGDIVSGLMRLAESSLIAVALAAGFAMSMLPFGL